MPLAFRPVDRVVPQIGRVTQAEQFHRFVLNAAFCQIIAGDLACCIVPQSILPTTCDLLVDLKQAVFEMPDLLLAGTTFVFERNLRAIREALHGLDEVNALVLPDERENVAAFVAAETVKNLAVRVDVEARGLLLVKRTKGDKIRACPFQREVRPNDIHNIAGGADSLQCGGGKQAGHGIGHVRRRANAISAWHQGAAYSFAFSCVGCGVVGSINRNPANCLIHGPVIDASKTCCCNEHRVGKYVLP